MKGKLLAIPAIFCLPLLGGCASSQRLDNRAAEPPPRVAGTADSSPESLYQLGRYYQGQGRHEQAIAAYVQALQAGSRFPQAHNGLGVVLSLQGRYDEAIQAFERAIREAPDDASLHSNLGYAYHLRGLDAQAVAALERAISLDPGNARARNNLEISHARMGKMLAPQVVVERVPEAIPVVRNRMEVVQSGPNVFELRERAGEVVTAQKPVAHVVSAATASPARLSARVEVSNGNGVPGMAKAVGEFLRDKGFSAARLTNRKPFGQEVTQIEYREGLLTEAERLRASLPGEMNLVETKDLRKDISLRLVLGRDIARSASVLDVGFRRARPVQTRQES